MRTRSSSHPTPKRLLYDFKVRAADGTTVDLDGYRGQLALIVNVASACGFTPQYEGLEQLYRRYREQGFVILGFPCNQFGAQESGDDAAIQVFCRNTYDISFPVFAKVCVNGRDADPLYTWLTSSARGWLGTRAIKWNFTKFLVGDDGHVLGRYAPKETPHALETHIRRALNPETTKGLVR